jgi:hypothetical protein
MLLNKRLGRLSEVCIKGAAQTFIRRDQNYDVALVAAQVQQWMMEIIVGALRELTQHFDHLICEGTRRYHSILRTLELSSRNHLHGFGNLLRVLNRFDAPANV